MYALQFLRTVYAQFNQSLSSKELATYVCGALLIKSSIVIMAPLLLRYLIPSDYALMTLLHSFTGLVTIIMGGGLKQVLLCNFFKHSVSEQKRFLITLVHVYGLYAFPLLGLGLYHANSIALCFFCKHACATYLIILALLYCFMFFFAELLYQVLILQRDARLVTSIQVSSNWFMVASSLFLLAYCSLGVYSILISYLIGHTLVVVWAVYMYVDTTAVSWELFTSSIKQMPFYLTQGMAFLPMLVCNWIILFAPRWLLAWSISLQDLGLYACADAGGQLYFLLITQPIMYAYVPRLLQAFSKDPKTTSRTEQQNRKITIFGIVLALVGLSIGYRYGRPFFEFLVPSAYHQAYTYIWYSVLGHIFFTGSCCLVPLVQMHHKSHYNALFSGLSTGVMMVGIFVGVPRWGVYAAAMVTACSQLLNFLLLYWYGHLLLKRLISHETTKTVLDEVGLHT